MGAAALHHPRRPEVLALAQGRLGSSRDGWVRIASTPRYPGAGIHALFEQSDQRYYWLPCPHCHLAQRLTWEANVDQEHALLVCSRCRQPLDLWAPGEWRAAAPGNAETRGYHVSRLYSPMANLPAMVRQSRQALSLHDQQAFQNEVLGEVHVPATGALSPDVLDRCRRTYRLDEYAGEVCDMGVDVSGAVLWVVVCGRPNSAGERRLWGAGTVRDFADLAPLLQRFHVRRCVIDSRPESRAARAFAAEHRGIVWLADYDRRQPGWEAVKRTARNDVDCVHLNRTDALDEVAAGFRDQRLLLPANARDLGGPGRAGLGAFYAHQIAPVPVYEESPDGEFERRYKKTARPEDFAHAEVYCLYASKLNSGGRIHRIRYV